MTGSPPPTGPLPPGDEPLEHRLAAALGHDPAFEPSPNGIARVRAAAEERAARHRHALPGGRSTPRRELLIGGIAASIGAAAGAAGVILGRGDDDEDEVPTEAIEMRLVDPSATATASLINHTWGVELLLDIEGLPAGNTYHVAYVRTDGTTIAAGSFLSVADVVMRCRFNAASLRDDTTTVLVRDADDAEVGRADLV